MFKKSWNPSAEGEYTIVASFAGTQSYGSSSAETAVVVGSATTGTPQANTGITTDIYIIIAAIVIVVVIIAAIVIFRKKK